MLSRALYGYYTTSVVSPYKPVDEFIHDWLTDPFFSHEDNFFDKNSSDIKLIEKENKYIIQFPVPGYNRHNLKLEVEANQLIVKAKTSRENGSSESTQLHSFVLPEDADTNRIKAHCLNGLLEVKIKKYTSVRRVKVIPVKGADSIGIAKEFSWLTVKNKLKNLLPSDERRKGKLHKQSWLKAMHNQRLRLRKIPHGLITSIKGMEISMIIFLQALFVLIVALLTGAFFIMHLLDQQSPGV